MSFSEWENKQTIPHQIHGLPLSDMKKWTAACNKMDGSQIHLTEWKKPESKLPNIWFHSCDCGNGKTKWWKTDQWLSGALREESVWGQMSSMREFLEDDRIVRCSNYGDSYTTLHVSKLTEMYTSKANFTAYKFKNKF